MISILFLDVYMMIKTLLSTELNAHCSKNKTLFTELCGLYTVCWAPFVHFYRKRNIHQLLVGFFAFTHSWSHKNEPFEKDWTIDIPTSINWIQKEKHRIRAVLSLSDDSNVLTLWMREFCERRKSGKPTSLSSTVLEIFYPF